MENNYSIDEILSAINDLQNKRKDKNKNIFKELPIKSDASNIPKNHLD